MITTELDRYEYTGNANPVVFRSGGTDIPIRNTAHVKVYVTTTGDFTVDTTDNHLDDTAHGHITGQQITLSSTSSLPTGLLANTIYYVVNPTLNTNNSFQVALTEGGTPVTISTAGSGTLTWTKTLLKTITTDYTVALVGTTATVTWESGKVPGSSDKVLFLRDVTFEQVTDLQNNSQFEAESVEGQLDLMVNMSQQLKNTSDRQFRFSNVLEASDATEASATLTATSAGRADKGLRFDSLGNLGVSTIDIDLAQDYILEAKSWSIEDGIVQTYDKTVASNVSPAEYSSKEYAQGDAPGGSSKEWAQDTSAAIDTTFSAKEYAQGTQASTGGSSKNWASQTGADITGGSSGDKSAKSWAIETGGTAPADGSAKEWATATGSAVASSEFSAKEYSQGVTATGGTAKQWALGGGSHVEATEVTSGLYSARKYASNASASASASAASASAAEGYTDAFDDRYLGSKSSVPTEDNDENPLTDGALYYNTTSNIMYVYDLGTTTWIALTIGELTTTGFAAATLVTQAEGIASNDNETTIPTSAAVKDYVDTSTATDFVSAASGGTFAGAVTFNAGFTTTDGLVAGGQPITIQSVTEHNEGYLNLISAGHGLVLHDRVTFTTTGTLPTGLTIGTVYYVVDVDGNYFWVGPSQGSTEMDFTDAGTGTHSAHKVNMSVVGGTTTGTFVGSLTGNVTGNASGTAATVTGAAQSAITSVGTLTGLTVEGITTLQPNGASYPCTIGFGGATGLVVSNTALGWKAMDDATGQTNTGIGSYALNAVSTGEQNTGVGSTAGGNITTGSKNTAVGRLALSDPSALTATGNVAVGFSALDFCTGDNNTAIGREAGYNITSGDANIIIGYDVDAPSATGDNQLNIGNTIYGDLSTGDIWTKTTGKIKQKGAFMQSSTHQALTLGG